MGFSSDLESGVVEDDGSVNISPPVYEGSWRGVDLGIWTATFKVPQGWERTELTAGRKSWKSLSEGADLILEWGLLGEPLQLEDIAQSPLKKVDPMFEVTDANMAPIVLQDGTEALWTTFDVRVGPDAVQSVDSYSIQVGDRPGLPKYWVRLSVVSSDGREDPNQVFAEGFSSLSSLRLVPSRVTLGILPNALGAFGQSQAAAGGQSFHQASIPEFLRIR